MAEQKWNVLYFEEWVKKEGLELIRGYKVDNVFIQPLRPWARTGGHAVQIQLEGTGELNAAYIKEPAQHLALKLSSRTNLVTRAHMGSMKSTRTGGNQMEYEDIPPDIMAVVKRIFVEECSKRGTPVHMEPIYGL